MRYIKFTLLIYSFLLTWGITTNNISADEVTPTTTSETTVTPQSQSTPVDSNDEDAAIEEKFYSHDVTIDKYNQNVANFNKVNTDTVKTMITENGNNLDQVLYIGRPTCYFCRQASPHLRDFNQLINNQLYYYDIDAEPIAHDFAFKEIGIPGTPTTMRLKNGKVISAWVGGEKTGQEFYDFLFSADANKLADSYTIKKTVSANTSNTVITNNQNIKPTIKPIPTNINQLKEEKTTLELVNTTSQSSKPVKKVQKQTTNKENKNSVLPQLGAVPPYHQPLFKLPIPRLIPKRLERIIALVSFLVLYIGITIWTGLSLKNWDKK
ncbi:thioredoxin family protein [Ligilactobacillus salivarius]|uniref:thioredoxin family protein n=1 Tax=Ligilactobacillus salivarius TaxID=1624 RepID=UPI003F21792F